VLDFASFQVTITTKKFLFPGIAHIATSFRDVLTINEGILLPFQSQDTLFAILIIVLHGWGLFSNSFIENERHVVWFFVATSVLVSLVSAFKNIRKSFVTFASLRNHPESGTLAKLIVYGIAIKLSSYGNGGIYESFDYDTNLFIAETVVPLVTLPILLFGVMAGNQQDR
jgi:hypothetical protein